MCTFDAEAVPNVVTPSTVLQSWVAATPLKMNDKYLKIHFSKQHLKQQLLLTTNIDDDDDDDPNIRERLIEFESYLNPSC